MYLIRSATDYSCYYYGSHEKCLDYLEKCKPNSGVWQLVIPIPNTSWDEWEIVLEHDTHE